MIEKIFESARHQKVTLMLKTIFSYIIGIVYYTLYIIYIISITVKYNVKSKILRISEYSFKDP